MKLFDKFFNKTGLVVVENHPCLEQRDVETIDVSDLKQYLVDEFEHVKQLETEIEKMKKDEEGFAVLKQKYDAAIATLDGYRLRKDDFERKIAFLEGNLKREREKNTLLIDEINTLKIKNKVLYDELVSEVKSKISENISGHKGNLSKKQAIEIINNLVIQR